MIRVLYRASSGETNHDLPLESLEPALQDEEGLLWVDLPEEDAESLALLLRDTFGFHPLAIEDALEQSHVPKIDDWDSYVYIVLHALRFAEEEEETLRTTELDVFLGHNFLVTYQAESIPALERVWATCQRDERYLQKGAGRLLYKLADELVADFLPVVDQIDETIDQIEDQVFDNPEQALLERIFRLKRALPYLRRTLNLQREVLNKIARGDDNVIKPEDRVYFRDVYDHLVRLHDMTEGLRDVAGGVLDTYLSVASNRMNAIMKTLTIFTVLVLPLTFLSGFFGMNFFVPAMPLPNWVVSQTAFVSLLIFMVLLPVGMYLWMRRRAWM